MSVKFEDESLSGLGSSLALVRDIISDTAYMDVYQGLSNDGGEIQLIGLSPRDMSLRDSPLDNSNAQEEPSVENVNRKLEFLESYFGSKLSTKESNGASLFDATKVLCKAGACYLGLTYVAGSLYFALTDYVFGAEVPWPMKIPAGIAAIPSGFLAGSGVIGLAILPIYSLKKYYDYFRGRHEYFDLVKINSQLASIIKGLKKTTKKGEFTTVVFVTNGVSSYARGQEFLHQNPEIPVTLRDLKMQKVVLPNLREVSQ